MEKTKWKMKIKYFRRDGNKEFFSRSFNTYEAAKDYCLSSPMFITKKPPLGYYEVRFYIGSMLFDKVIS